MTIELYFFFNHYFDLFHRFVRLSGVNAVKSNWMRTAALLGDLIQNHFLGAQLVVFVIIGSFSVDHMYPQAKYANELESGGESGHGSFSIKSDEISARPKANTFETF